MKSGMILAFFGILLFNSCIPKPPGSQFIKARKALDEQGLMLMDISDEVVPRSDVRAVFTAKRNMLYIAVDDTVQPQFSGHLMDLYKTTEEVRIEDVSWWRFSRRMVGLYDKVIRIPHDNFNKESLRAAIKRMEKLNKPYDIFLMTHGFPNLITPSKGFDFIDYEDIQGLKDIISDRLQFVFMQGCFGNTLVPDFHELGAKEILSYDGWNRNFFYVDFFFKNYKKYNYNVKKAFDKTNKTIQKKMRRSFLYKKILSTIGLTVDEYFSISPNPEYSQKK